MKFPIVTCVCLSLCTLATPLHVIEDLRPMNVLRDHLTLSGFSSGGGFAQMVQFAYSSMVQGVGVFSHTFYRCGPPSGRYLDWDNACTILFNQTQSDWYDPELVHTDIQDYYSKGLIENPLNLRNKRLYVYTGLRSFIFNPVQSMNILKVYERYIRNPYKVKTRIQDSVFVMPTDNHYGVGCKHDASKNFFIGNCGFSGAFEALKFLHCDDFKLHHPRTIPMIELQPLRSFNQSRFLHGLARPQMDDVGFFYVPTRCINPTRPCLFHVFFHGCSNNRNNSGSNFIANSGFLEVAEVNDIVMLFPQNYEETLRDTPAKGCWDTFGYSGPLYATQKGDQLTAVWRMISHLMSAGSHSIAPNQFPAVLNF